jgi:hypothetical protein
MAQGVECLPTKFTAQNSNPGLPNQQQKIMRSQPWTKTHLMKATKGKSINNGAKMKIQPLLERRKQDTYKRPGNTMALNLVTTQMEPKGKGVMSSEF